MNIVKAFLNMLIRCTESAHRIGKRTASVVSPFICEKIGDVKFKSLCLEALLNFAEHVTPKYMLKQMASHGKDAKNPKVLEELAFAISKFLDEFGPAGFPIDAVIPFCVVGCGHTNKKVRDASIELIKSIYRFVGEPIKDFLKDVKDSTLKVIMAELDKTEIVKPEEVQQKRVLRDEDEEEKVPAGGIELPRQDVSKEMSNSKLIAKLTDKNWKNKKEGLDKVGAILDGANNRIEPKGLKDLFGALKLGIGDKNKNVLKMVL